MRRLATSLLLYTEKQAADIRLQEPRVLAYVAPNAIYSREQLYGLGHSDIRNTLLWIGRLVPEKAPLLALSAFAALAAQTSKSLRLLIVGDGPLRQELEEAAGPGRFGRSSVSLLGHVDDAKSLRQYFSQAAASISSGYVGLNVTQSLGFGCPVIWAEHHLNAPEVAVLDDFNSLRFLHGEVNSLSEAMSAALAMDAANQFDRPAISRAIRASYSTEAMAAGFLAATRNSHKDHRRER